jgi:hypothetical protein
MRYDRTVLAYHGCDAVVADQLLAGTPFTPSRNDYDWLGDGIYFWEHGLDRTLRFARVQQERGKVVKPTVVGAILQLGRCFDLLDTQLTDELPDAYELCARIYGGAEALPKNEGKTPDRALRRLDRLVLNAYLERLDTAGEHYQTVRAAFEEGEPAFPGSMIRRETHIQIAVRDARCVLGVFRPMMQ